MEEVKTEVLTDEEKKNKEQKTTKQKVIFGLKIAGNVVFYALIIALFLFSLMNIRGGNGKKDFPNLFGSGILTVKTPSMSHYDSKGNLKSDELFKNYNIKDGFTTADLLHAKTFNESKVNDLKVGDVIVFYDPDITDPQTGEKGWLNTHRIVVIHKNSSNNVDYVIAEGDYYYYDQQYDKITDMSVKQMMESSGIVQNVTPDRIKGIVTSVNKGGAAFFKWIQSSWLWIFVFPVALLLAFEIFLVIKNILAYRKEKLGLNNGQVTDEDRQKMLEEEKEKLRAELLAELQAQGLAPKAEENKPEEVKETESVENNEVQEEPQKEEIKEEQKDEPVVLEEKVESNDSNEEVVENNNEEKSEEKASE